MNLRQRFASWYDASDSTARLAPLEGVRGFAVLLVFFVHFDAIFEARRIAPGVLSAIIFFLGDIGHLGVDLFFALSGFLIYGALMRRPVGYFRFIRRRVQRIYPAFLAVLAIYVVLSALLPSASKFSGSVADRAWYLLQNTLLLPGVFPISPIMTVAWSLSYELFFYLSMPLAVIALRLRRWRPAGRVVLFAAFWSGYLVCASLMPHSRARMLMFLAGVILHDSGSWPLVRRTLVRCGEASMVALFALACAFIFALDRSPSFADALPFSGAGRTELPGVMTAQGPYKVVALSVVCYLLLAFCLEINGRIRRVFCWRPLRCLGNMSYSYYLMHGLTLLGAHQAVSAIAPEPAGNLALLGLCLITFACTWATSTLLFCLVEKPLSLRPASIPKAIEAPVRPLTGKPERSAEPEPVAR